MAVGAVSIILLAAGASSRMGRSKQLLAWNAETLLSHSINIALGSKASSVLVILGANEEAHRLAIQHLPVTIISNPNWSKGMGSSLKIGLEQALKTNPSIEAALVMVCDQPFVTSAHLDSMIREFETTGRHIIASKYAGTLGVPALFDKSLFEKMIGLEDAQGAKTIIQDCAQKDVVGIDFPLAATDLDTYEEYLQFHAPVRRSTRHQ